MILLLVFLCVYFFVVNQIKSFGSGGWLINPASQSPGRHSGALEAETFVVTAVDIFNQFVHIGRVAFAGHFQRFLEGLAARQQTAEPQECPTSQTGRGKREKWE